MISMLSQFHATLIGTGIDLVVVVIVGCGVKIYYRLQDRKVKR